MTVKLLHNPEYPTEIDALCNPPPLLTFNKSIVLYCNLSPSPSKQTQMNGSLFLSVLQMGITSSNDY